MWMEGDRYEFRDDPVSDPGVSITITSSLGGSASRTVDHN
jgi:hypothetical protein